MTGRRLLLGVTAAFLLVIAFWVLYRGPITSLSVELRTEIVTVTVGDSNASKMLFRRARLEGSDECLIDLVVKPPRGSTVTYMQTARELRVRIEGESIWEHGRENVRAEHRRPGLQEIVVRPGECGNEKEPHVRLPIHGTVVFGGALQRVGHQRSESLVLLSGKLLVHSRALPDFLWLPLGVRPFLPNALYPVQQMEIPGGTIVTGEGGSESGVPPWRGFADTQFGDEGPKALSVSASTNVARAHLYLPSGRVVGDDAGNPATPDVVGLSLLARLTGDPNLQLLYAAFGVFALVVSAWAALFDLLKPERDEAHARVEPPTSPPPRRAPGRRTWTRMLDRWRRR